MANENIVVSLRAGTSLVNFRPIFSHDSKCLFICAGQVIKVFSTISGQLVRELIGHTGFVTGIQINPTNRLQLLSCSEDGFVIKWDFNDGVLLRKYNIHSPLMGIFTNEKNTYLIKKSSNYHYNFVSCNFKGTSTTSVAETETLVSDIENDQRKLSFGCQGDMLATVKKDALTLNHLTSKKKIKHIAKGFGKYGPIVFTCVACHPTDHCVVTGFSDGRICYWRHILSVKHVVKSFVHWHSLSLKTLTFSEEGSYLLSGGHECVLVKWQYDSHHRDFLPRLSAPIEHVTCSPDSSTYAVSHSDNVIHLISNSFKVLHIYEGLTAAHLKRHTEEFVPTGLLYDPRSRALVMNGRPGHLQFYSVHDDKQLYNLDIVSKNYISPSNLEEPPATTEVKKAAFSDSGDWLVTFQMWNDGVRTQDSFLKFWQFDNKSRQYVLNTIMGLPHEKGVRCLKFQPDTKTLIDKDTSPLCVSTSQDGKFKLWNLIDDTDIYRENSRWNCDSVGFYRDLQAGDACFAEDGSLLAVVFESVITLWIPDTNYMKATFINTVNSSESIRQVQFGRKSCCHLLVSTTSSHVVLWNLKTSSIQWCINVDVGILVEDPLTENMAIFTTNNNLFVFKPSDANPMYTHSAVCSSKILSALFLPHRKQVDYSPGSRLSWQHESRLYFFTQNQELLYLAEENYSENATESQVRIQENLPQTPFSILFAEHRKSGVVKDTPSYHEQQTGKPEAGFVKEFIETPAHVLPPMSSLCQTFIETMLLGKKSDQHDSDSGEDSEGEKDSDSDSDMDTSKPIQKRSQEELDPHEKKGESINDQNFLDTDEKEVQKAFAEDYGWFLKKMKSKKS